MEHSLTLQHFQQLADKANLSGPVTDLSAFAHNYLEVFSKGYNYAFGIAACTMMISLLVYIIFNKFLPNKEKKVTEAAEKVEFQSCSLFCCNCSNGNYCIWIKLYQFRHMSGWATGFAFGLFAAFVTWIILSCKERRDVKNRCACPCIYCCDILLDVISSEWTDTYPVCT